MNDCPYEDWLNLGKLKIPHSVNEKINLLASQMVDKLKKKGSYNNWIDITIDANSIWKILNFESAYGANVNLDYFPVNIVQLPINFATPEALQEHIRTHINDFVNTEKSSFHASTGYTNNESIIWNSNNPLGAIIHIEIPIFSDYLRDDGDVIVSKYSPESWVFTTIQSPYSHQHPVSGNREFGFNVNNNGGYTFYTRGLDRITDMSGSLIEFFANLADESQFNLADPLWESFQSKIARFVNDRGGIAIIETPVKMRPNFNSIKNYITGQSDVKPNCQD